MIFGIYDADEGSYADIDETKISFIYSRTNFSGVSNSPTNSPPFDIKKCTADDIP